MVEDGEVTDLILFATSSVSVSGTFTSVTTIAATSTSRACKTVCESTLGFFSESPRSDFDDMVGRHGCEPSGEVKLSSRKFGNRSSAEEVSYSLGLRKGQHEKAHRTVHPIFPEMNSTKLTGPSLGTPSSVRTPIEGECPSGASDSEDRIEEKA